MLNSKYTINGTHGQLVKCCACLTAQYPIPLIPCT